MIKYENLENLKKWIEEVQAHALDFNAILDELVNSEEVQGVYFGEIDKNKFFGQTSYELSKHFTKSKLPELYNYSVLQEYEPENDSYITTFIF